MYLHVYTGDIDAYERSKTVTSIRRIVITEDELRERNRLAYPYGDPRTQQTRRSETAAAKFNPDGNHVMLAACCSV